MTLLIAILFLATVADGFFGGIALQKSLVELPARKKIGPVAFARYARASDLGNGRIAYPLFAIGGFLLKGILLLLAFRAAVPFSVLFPLSLAAAFGLGMLVMTAFAAPQMLHVGKTPDLPEALSPLLEKFVTYSLVRAVFIWAQGIAMLWALMAAVGR